MISLKELLKLPQDDQILILDSLKGHLEATPVGVRIPLLTTGLNSNLLQRSLSGVGERIEAEKASYYPALAAFASVNYGRPGN